MKLKKYKIYIYLVLIFVLVALLLWRTKSISETETQITKTPPPPPKTKLLFVPFVSESPGGISGRNWINACEEATLTMVDKFYAGEKTVTDLDAQKFMEMLFTQEDKIYGSNANTDAARTAYLANQFSHFNAVVVENPTIDQIKQQLLAGHPIISFHYGFALKNPNIPFLATGSSYHVMTVIGYDDNRGDFITNDDGDKVNGAQHFYNYDLFMSSLHDYDFSDSKADGPARVLFTSPKSS